jgi:hypothetical protein
LRNKTLIFTCFRDTGIDFQCLVSRRKGNAFFNFSKYLMIFFINFSFTASYNQAPNCFNP